MTPGEILGGIFSIFKAILTDQAGITHVDWLEVLGPKNLGVPPDRGILGVL